MPPSPLPTSYFKFSFSKACYRKYSDRFVVVLTSNSFAKGSERSLHRLQLLPGIAVFFPFTFFFLGRYIFKRKKACMNLLLCGAVRWVATEIKVFSPLNKHGMESANSLFSKSVLRMYICGWDLAQPCLKRARARESHVEQVLWTQELCVQIRLIGDNGPMLPPFFFTHYLASLSGASQGNCDFSEKIIITGPATWIL